VVAPLTLQVNKRFGEPPVGGPPETDVITYELLTRLAKIIAPPPLGSKPPL
jgi:hypothetical protein